MSSSPNSREITEAQKSTLNALKCIRVSYECISSLCSPATTADPPHILDCFRSSDELKANEKKVLASYVVVDGKGLIYLFFSLRCGELFRPEIPEAELRLAIDGYEAMRKLAEKKSLSSLENKRLQTKVVQAWNIFQSFDNIEKVATDIAPYYVHDLEIEPSKEINRVSGIHPGVELKYFGKTKQGENAWKTASFPHKLGVTLFWKFVVPKLSELTSIAGCEYFYLFAADETPDGKLIKHYKENLGFDCPGGLTANKPRFDYQSIFLYQSIQALENRRNDFFDKFNPENDIKN